MGKHLWADSYDRELKEVFSVMDEITRRIITELKVKLTVGEAARYSDHATDNFAAFDLYLQGVKYWLRFDKESNSRAKQLLTQALELDSKYARAMAYLSWAHMNDARYFSKDRKKSFQMAEQWAQRALAIGDKVGPAHTLLSRLYTYQRKYEQAIAAGESAVEAEPNSSGTHSTLALTMIHAGKPEEALVMVKKAMRLSPYYSVPTITIAGLANFFTGRFEEGIPILKEGVMRSKGQQSRACQRLLIASYMKLGRENEAKAEVEKYLQRDPKYSLKRTSTWLKRVHKDPAIVNFFLEALRQAGLPE